MKQEKSEINNLIYHLKELEKQNPKSAKRGNNEDQTGNKIEIRKITWKINKTKTCFLFFFERIKKIHKPLARLIEKKRERPQINKRNEREAITSDTPEIQTSKINLWLPKGKGSREG